MKTNVNQTFSERKHPVHMPPVERHNMPVIVFVTIGLQPRVPELADCRFHDVFILACKVADAWRVGQYVIMPDHLHLFCQRAGSQYVMIKQWTSFLKRQITIHYGAHDWSWQNDIWDTQMRSGEHYHDKWEYVRQNPVRKELVQKSEDWPWQGKLHTLRW